MDFTECINTVRFEGEIKFRRDFEYLWAHTFDHLDYQPVAYTNASLEYQLAYQRSADGASDWQDLSLIIFWGGKPAALWPLSISGKNQQFKLSSQGFPVYPPAMLPWLSFNSRKRIVKYCLKVANTLAKQFGIENWESAECFSDSIGLSDWHKVSVENNALCTLKYELYEDLKPTITDIKRNFRRSYKSLINTASRTWSSGILAQLDTGSVWDQFRGLHFKVAQRATRSDETWKLQLLEIERRNAFLVWLRNDAGEMVGGGYFNFTRDEGLYAVGAYDRSLFDRPLGHLVQYRAIEELKKRGVRWYKIGARPYLTDTPRPTEKEISIGNFKQGFSSTTFPKYHFIHEVVSAAKC